MVIYWQARNTLGLTQDSPEPIEIFRLEQADQRIREEAEKKYIQFFLGRRNRLWHQKRLGKRQNLKSCAEVTDSHTLDVHASVPKFY
jgi:hypothetical protein